MKIVIKKIIDRRSVIYLFFLFFLLKMNLHAQPCLILVKDTLSNIQIEFKIDNNKFKRKVTNYEEGKFIDYYFENSSIITLFKGSNQKIPLLSVDEGYKVIKCEKKNNRTICQGRKDGKYWREDVFINEIIVCYDNVESAKKDYYDKVLDSIFLINIVSSDDFVATINKKGFRYI